MVERICCQVAAAEVKKFELQQDISGLSAQKHQLDSGARPNSDNKNTHLRSELDRVELRSQSQQMKIEELMQVTLCQRLP